MVQQIKLQSGVRSIRFGNRALMEFEKATGRSLFGGSIEGLSVEETTHLAHAGLKDAARLENKECELSFDDVLEELNEPGAIVEVMRLFGEAMPKHFNQEAVPGKKPEQQAKK